MAPLSESSALISKIESSSISTPIYSDFSNYLPPLINLTSKPIDRKEISALLPFLNRCLSILPKRLSRHAEEQDGKIHKPAVNEWFDTYRLCLNYLESFSSQLSGKPYTVYVQRLRLVYCLDAWGFYKEGEIEGFRVLERLRDLDLRTSKVEKKKLGEYLPFLVENGDLDFAKIVVEVVVAIVKCMALGQSKNDGEYKKVIGMVQEVKPWFRVLDANACEKLHRMLVTYLGKCTLFMAGELMNFERDTICTFCTTILNEFAESSMKEETYKFARRICSLLFLQVGKSSLNNDILMCVLDSLAQKCKVEVAMGIKFVELVAYCANKCQYASKSFCGTVAECLNDLASIFYQVMMPLEPIIRLYAIGLCFLHRVAKCIVSDIIPSKGTKDDNPFGILFDDGVLCNLAPVLCSLRSYFYDGCEENHASFFVEFKDFPCDLHLDSTYGPFLNRAHKSREVCLAYLYALKFLCEPLSKLVNSQKHIILEGDASSVSSMWYNIQEAFHQFCDIFLYFHRTSSKAEVDDFDENKLVVSVSVATFVLSIRTKHKLQKSVHLIKHIIASEWVQHQGLKYILASLYNASLLLHRNKQVNEALKALKLCCRASWNHVKLLCDMSLQKSDVIDSDLSEDAILDFVTQACAQTTFLLDVLYQSGIFRVKKIMVNSLKNWCFAEDLFRRLSGLMPLLKQWVKICCKINNNMEVDGNAPTLYYLLSSVQVSKRTIGKILEQELIAYEEMHARHPEFCERMQMKVIDILLQVVYDTDCHLQRSRVLIRKGRVLRTCGLEGLRDCIQCLSEAISLVNDESCSSGAPTCHHLAVTYCLRALCTQELEPNSKQVFIDIKAALDLWLNIPIGDYGFAYDEGSVSPYNALLLLYNIVDLLALKGSLEFHRDIYTLMIRLFQWKNVQLEKCLSILWESRRLTHALCCSAVNHAFVMNLSGSFGENFRSIDSWVHCLKGSPPSLVGFQHNFSFLFTNSSHGYDNHETSFQYDISVDDVKEAACKLISSVPVTSCSFFIAGYLYYDLCERLIANGHIFEALLYAKEAHRLRTKLFREKFMYTVEKQTETYNEAGDHMQKLTNGLPNLKIYKSISPEVWSFNTLCKDMDSCYLSAWKILQSYLESTLQVGIIHEMIGNGFEAEKLLLWGKDISCSQCLPLFIVGFSSVLGKLYRKKGSWDMSEKELQSAKNVLVHSCADFSCLKCRLMLESSIDQELGDLSRSFFSTTKCVSIERVSVAESLYRSALARLYYPDWKAFVSYSEDTEEIEGAIVCTSTSQLGSKLKMENQKYRKTKNAPRYLSKEQCSVTDHKTRLTRSKSRSFKNQNVDNSRGVQINQLSQLDGYKMCATCVPNGQRQELLGKESCTIDLGCEISCICSKKKCWFCLVGEVKESGLFCNFIHLKWELARRRLSVRLLSGIGKCLEVRGRIHEAHEIISQSISVLVSRNPFIHAHTPLTFLLDLVGKELSGDVFSVERAVVLSNICWFSLRTFSKDTGTMCCDLHHVQLPKIVSWLMLAFVLCREVPALFQKVSRLLAAIFVLSSSSKKLSLPNFCNVLSESHWASYFHQASIGNNLSYQFLSNTTPTTKAQNLINDQGSYVTTSAGEGARTCNLLRLAPGSFQDLEQFVTDFYSNLPCTTVICISLIRGSCAKLLQELLLCPSHISAWMLLSRLEFSSQPIVMLLPMDPVLEDEGGAISDARDFLVGNNLGKHWECPWGLSVVDDVAPSFRFILEENYLSSSVLPVEDTKKNRTLWWMQRKNLDYRLGKLLRNIEDSWLGPWSFVLLGNCFNSSHLDSVAKKLKRELKSKCKINTDDSHLKVILQGTRHALDGEARISLLSSLKKGCFIGKPGCSEHKSYETFSKESEGDKTPSDLAVQLLYEAVNELEEEESTIREPTILVLDREVQMLPWENIPILRNQEVYRMPSIGSICFALDRSCRHKEPAGKITAAVPMIDPLDAFYLLNPSGDLSQTQMEFETWFRDNKLEGKAGCAPTSEELSSALKSHDLFLYFGHGSGEQYISQKEIQDLENCAATLLMGCSSGSLLLSGCYVPRGTALSFLLAGSPIIIANLWEVTDKDIDRFGKAMLDAWLKERSSVSAGCDQCNLACEELEAMEIRDGKRNVKKKMPETCHGGLSMKCCDHRQKIGAFMGQSREACTLPFLIGAAPVCYGIPTGIRRKKDL